MILTSSISIEAPPEAVLRFVADARNLPDWAPAFAQRVRPDGEDWLVDSGGAQLRIRVRVDQDSGTVDFLRAGGTRGRPAGAFTRVVPNGEGSEYVFMRPLPEGTTRDDLAREEAVVAAELATVRARCEAVPRQAAS